MTPTNSTDALDLCRRVAERVKRDGGRALLVGGAVRDKVMGLDPKDFDLEIYGVQPDDLERLLGEFGRVDAVGKSFGVLKLTVDGRTMDISTPRRESKEGRGHRGFIATPDPSMTVEDALRRRDFTMNAMAEDPLTGEFFDPFRGKDDIAVGVIRAVDARTFPDDPLRVLRAAQFSSRLDFFVEPLTAMYCQGIVESGEVATLPRERVGEEWRKLLLGKNPSRGMIVLKNAGALRVLHPELDRLDIVPQDPKWHEEGSVWLHTLLAVKAARPLAEALPEESRFVVMLATLLHDVGKLTTTARKDDGGISSIGHEDVGAEMALRVMTEQMLVDADTAKKVVRIVAEHLVPKFFYKDKVNDAAVRRLARRLEPASIEDLCAVARADSLGRIPAKGLEPEDWLEARARDMKVERQGPQPILMGRHLIERGWTPGKEMGDALRRVFEMQLDGRVTTLDHALGAVAAAGAVPVPEPSLKGAP
jgi:tRNA nucleotidyltransferase (CCA-adding enzyme)